MKILASSYLDTIANMVVQFLTDPDIMTEKLYNQICKCLDINYHNTSTYALQVAEVQDINALDNDPKHAGWYIMLQGTRCGVNFFVNNEMEITRKPLPSKCRVVKSYSLYNNMKFYEGFWRDNFSQEVY